MKRYRLWIAPDDLADIFNVFYTTKRNWQRHGSWALYRKRSCNADGMEN